MTIAEQKAMAAITVAEFLDVADDRRDDFKVHNQAKSRRWASLSTMAWAVTNLKRALGIVGGLGLWRRIDALNRVERPRSSIGPEMKAVLSSYFDADIERLQALIGRDLSHWRA